MLLTRPAATGSLLVAMTIGMVVLAATTARAAASPPAVTMTPRFRNELGQQFQPLGCEFDGDKADSGNVAAGPGKTGDEARIHRIATADKYDRDRRGRVFSCS
jgi:hypothetical protein